MHRTQSQRSMSRLSTSGTEEAKLRRKIVETDLSNLAKLQERICHNKQLIDLITKLDDARGSITLSQEECQLCSKIMIAYAHTELNAFMKPSGELHSPISRSPRRDTL